MARRVRRCQRIMYLFQEEHDEDRECCGEWRASKAWGSSVRLGGFPGGTVAKNPPAGAADQRDAGSIPGLGSSPGGWHDNPLQYACLDNTMDRGAWWATVHGVANSRTRLSTHTKKINKSLVMMHKITWRMRS